MRHDGGSAPAHRTPHTAHRTPHTAHAQAPPHSPHHASPWSGGLRPPFKKTHRAAHPARAASRGAVARLTLSFIPPVRPSPASTVHRPPALASRVRPGSCSAGGVRRWLAAAVARLLLCFFNRSAEKRPEPLQFPEIRSHFPGCGPRTSARRQPFLFASPGTVRPAPSGRCPFPASTTPIHPHPNSSIPA